MNILVLNGSPAGKNSVTLQTALYIEKLFGEHSFDVIHVGQRIRSIEKDFSESEEKLKNADVILFCYPVYTFLVPSQLHRFIELIKEKDVDVSGKTATQISTSKHFYDSTAHRFIQDNCADLGLNYVRGLSADMDDILKEEGRKQAEDFFRFTLWSIENKCFEKPFLFGKKALLKAGVPENGAEKTDRSDVVIVADLGEDGGNLAAMINRFEKVFPGNTRTVDISEFPFSGGCLGCFNCASSGKCIYKDGFDSFLRERIQASDAIVYAFRIKDHSMGSRFKMYDDRQFCNGHRTVTMGKPVGYLIDGALSDETNVRALLESRAQVGGNFLAGLACSENAPEEEIDRMAKTLLFALKNDYRPPADFYGVGGMKIFRDLIYQMRGLMKADHAFYKKNGFYNDFPQRHKGTTAAMYLVGGMMKNKAVTKKIGGKMTDFMVMPYQKAIEKAAKEKNE